MGLVTSLYRFIEPTTENLRKFKNSDFTVDQDDEPIPEQFKYQKIEHRYDWEKIMENHQITKDDVKFRGYGWDDDYNCVTYVMELQTHELSQAYEYLNKNWSGYHDTWQEFKSSDKYKEFQKFLPILRKYGWRKNYHWFSSGNGKYSYNLVKAWRFTRERLKVVIIDLPTNEVQVQSVIGSEELWVGKAANKSFYDVEKYCNLITTKSELNEMLDNHFTENKDEYNINKVKEIRENFIEGVHFVVNH